MDGREAYQGIKSDYYTRVHDLPPQIGACQNAGDYERYQREVDGGAWQTDAALATMLEPMLPADPQEAARDAVRRTLSNFDAVVRFACRGAGEKGRKRVSAPLADPSAVPNEDCTGIVGEALGTVLAAMLEYCGPCDAAAVVFPARGGDGSAPAAAAATLSAAEKEAVRNSLEYLRERVGVPRDMTVHGARLFRAHINAYLQQLK
jgi:glutathione S-transferase